MDLGMKRALAVENGVALQIKGGSLSAPTTETT